MKPKTVVFAGLPNTGKSSWINLLSGSHLMTGNWNGVTIEKTESVIEIDQQIYHLIDLPGIQGLDQQNDEERITENFLHHEHIDCLVQVMDSTHMEASLMLMMKLRQLQIPMLCLLNFKDEAGHQHIHINTDKLMHRCSIPMLLVSALDKADKDFVWDLIKNQCSQQAMYRPLLNPEADRIFETFAQRTNLRNAIIQFEQSYPQTAASQRHEAVQSCMRFVEGNLHEQNQRIIQIDRFLLCTGLGKSVLIFGLLLSFMTMLWVGNQASGLFEFFLFKIEEFVTFKSSILSSWISSVLFEGAGSLAGFIPQLYCFYVWISILEESGCMIRLSLMMEPIMRSFQLTGKSWISFMFSQGCNAAAVVHTTSLESESLRRKCALLVPFCSCSALLPVYLYFQHLIFKEKGFVYLMCFILLGCITVLFLSILIQKVSSEPCPEQQIAELVPYRIMNIGQIHQKSILQIKKYIHKILHIMFYVLNIIWMMNVIKIHNASMLEHLSKMISAVFIPLGFGQHWIYTASLFPAIFAKEASIGALSMLQMMNHAVLSQDTSMNLSYLVFLSLSPGCTMTLTMIKEKYGLKLMLISMILSFTISYAASLFIYHFTLLF